MARAVLILFAASLAAQTYVGSETCGTCHEGIYQAWAKTPHRDVKQACKSCHGTGSRHAESTSAADILNPAKLPPAESDRDCLSCHLNRPTHVGRIQSSHAHNQVACITCHTIHATAVRGPNALNRQCTTCHMDVRAEFQRPYHHRLPEGAVSCVDCHNPHGSFRPGMMRQVAANDVTCFKCHGDKRGPFTFEHAPVRFEGCASCHEPHGSANPRMLTRHEVRLVCLECHANLPATAAPGVVLPSFHDLRSPRYQNCTVCHQKVHGSHVDRNFLR